MTQPSTLQKTCSCPSLGMWIHLQPLSSFARSCVIMFLLGFILFNERMFPSDSCPLNPKWRSLKFCFPLKTMFWCLNDITRQTQRAGLHSVFAGTSWLTIRILKCFATDEASNARSFILLQSWAKNHVANDNQWWIQLAHGHAISYWGKMLFAPSVFFFCGVPDGPKGSPERQWNLRHHWHSPFDIEVPKHVHHQC